MQHKILPSGKCLGASAIHQLAYCLLDDQWELAVSDSPRVPNGTIGNSPKGLGGKGLLCYGTPPVLTRYGVVFLTQVIPFGDDLVRQDVASCVTCWCLYPLRESRSSSPRGPSVRRFPPFRNPCHQAGRLRPLPRFTNSFGTFGGQDWIPPHPLLRSPAGIGPQQLLKSRRPVGSCLERARSWCK